MKIQIERTRAIIVIRNGKVIAKNEFKPGEAEEKPIVEIILIYKDWKPQYAMVIWNDRTIIAKHEDADLEIDFYVYGLLGLVRGQIDINAKVKMWDDGTIIVEW